MLQGSHPRRVGGLVRLGMALSLLQVLPGAVNDAPFSLVPKPDRAAIGSVALITWTISDRLPSGALVDVVIMQDDIDRLLPRWYRSGTLDLPTMGPMRSGISRSLRPGGTRRPQSGPSSAARQARFIARTAAARSLAAASMKVRSLPASTRRKPIAR